MRKSSLSIQKSAAKKISAGLARVLADTFRLYQKTHAFHWNVQGPYFSELHTLFEHQYQDLWAAADGIAERIRALDFFVPGTNTDFEKLSSIKEEPSVPTAMMMVEQLLEGHETVLETIRSAYRAAEDANDKATMNLYDDRILYHEKQAWMLRSHLAQYKGGEMVEKSPLKALS